MLPLYHDPHFTFCFADNRIIPRFHLEGVTPGTHVSVIKINAESGGRLGLLATATVGDGGWIDLPQPIIVRAGEGFIAVPVTHQTLTILPDTFAIYRLNADAAIPAWDIPCGENPPPEILPGRFSQLFQAHGGIQENADFRILKHRPTRAVRWVRWNRCSRGF